MHRRVLVRADADKEINDAPSEEEEGGRGLPAFLKPLTDFGVGRTSVWEGGVGLFIIVGAGMFNVDSVWYGSAGSKWILRRVSVLIHSNLQVSLVL